MTMIKLFQVAHMV